MKTPVYPKSILASYATFKELYKSQKYNSPYQILGEFISYIITSRALYGFTSTEIQGYLNEEFGFDLPVAVIRTALKNINGISRDNNRYIVDRLRYNRKSDFQSYRIKSEEQSATINDKLVRYVKEKNEDIDLKKLSQELIAFVLGDEGEQKYQQLISEFVIANESDEAITNTLSTILEGGILYTGLTYNISEFGSLKKPLTLFLDTEILFDIAGLNGELYQALAFDFYNLVNAANRGGKIIHLKYFSKVENDIDQFYYKAEQIVSGNGDINFSEAMKEIVKGCEDASDVSAKKVDFFRKLHTEFGITKDEKRNYYTDYDNKYNLEGIHLTDYPSSDESNFEGLMFCSNINKLRKGIQETDYLSSQFICITDTRRVQDISNALTEELKNIVTGEKYCGYAISLNYITNLLWYKMNRGFGTTEFPTNLDAVIKARIILSGYVNQGISSTYKNIKAKFLSGELSEEQAAAYIIALKEKSGLPEDLDNNSSEDLLNFSDEYLNGFAEKISHNHRLLKEREKTISQLSKNVKELEAQLDEANRQSDNKQEQIDLLSSRLDAIEEEKKQVAKEKRVRNARKKLVLKIAWKCILAIVVVFSIWFVCKKKGLDFGTWLSVALGIIGCISGAVWVYNKDLKSYMEECKDLDNYE